jgi:hypothetical protein
VLSEHSGSIYAKPLRRRTEPFLERMNFWRATGQMVVFEYALKSSLIQIHSSYHFQVCIRITEVDGGRVPRIVDDGLLFVGGDV